jgi:hypothetical protein
MGAMRNANRVLVRKPTGKRSPLLVLIEYDLWVLRSYCMKNAVLLNEGILLVAQFSFLTLTLKTEVEETLQVDPVH